MSVYVRRDTDFNIVRWWNEDADKLSIYERDGVSVALIRLPAGISSLRNNYWKEKIQTVYSYFFGFEDLTQMCLLNEFVVTYIW
jgi:hypothetical protein